VRIKKGDAEIKEDNVIRSDASLFDVFTLPMIDGDPHTALKDPHSVVITESMAWKYFGRTAVVGQTLFFANDSLDYKITGVIRDVPRSSHFKADFFLSTADLPEINENNWTAMYYSTYIVLRPDADVQHLAVKLPAFFRHELNEARFGVDAFEAGGNYYRLSLIPLTDIHLHSNRSRELAPNSSFEYIYIFSAIALLILVMACVNFMNLSTARSAGRARDVGVRKVLGSSRPALIMRFLLESITVTAFAALLAILLSWLLLPLFNRLSGKEITISLSMLGWLLPSAVVGILVIGVAAGAYPAFFLSAFQPVDVLKGKLAGGFKGGGLRSFLVVFQFAMSVFLMISTGVVQDQLKYIRNKDLGYDRSQVLTIRNAGVLGDPGMIRQEMKQLSGVEDATVTTFPPTGKIRWPHSVTVGRTSVQLEHWPVDANYIATMGMHIVKGRNFSEELKTDSNAIILNESAIALMGIAKDPLGAVVEDGNKKFHVVGIVKDFNFNSLRNNITPLSLVLGGQDANSLLCIRTKTKDLPGLMDRIEGKWKQMAPHIRFDYSFMDQDFDALYQAELRLGHVFTSFAALAIFIACLGLFGLAAYAAERRNKEIGIRKVLGASVSGVVVLLSKDFIRLTLIAFAIAAPVAWWVMHRWLRGFAYRVTIPWTLLVIAGATAVAIAFVTISFQSLKAANANPIKSLRSE
jgi:putative ABC transport system permease protein